MKRNYSMPKYGRMPVYVRGKNGEPGSRESRFIECYVDWDALLWQLGTKAVASKSGFSSALGGIIKVKEVRGIPEEARRIP